MMVDMERSYITAGFFRYTMHRRFEQFQQNALLHQALNKQPAKRGFFGLGKGEDNNAAAGGPPDPSGRSGSSAAGPTGAGQVGGLSDGDAFLAGYLDKKVNEESARQSMPVNAWRYQKRFFVYNGEGRGGGRVIFEVCGDSSLGGCCLTVGGSPACSSSCRCYYVNIVGWCPAGGCLCWTRSVVCHLERIQACILYARRQHLE
jgi:hypothetical protein